MENNKQFQPYVPAGKITPELTVTSVIMGILLSVIFGAANAYLGLRVGMTVSASIPAAVISMGVIRVIMRKNSILESNIVQTIGSAGESVAAGAIFTMPALFMWANNNEHGIGKPGLLEITIIALLGGVLGVFFMIPLRNALIVKEHGTLPYPEGQACAEVLMAGEKGGSSASTVFLGMGFAAAFKFIVDGLKVAKGTLFKNGSVKTYPGGIGTEVYPALLSVGYICGPRISSYMFAGSVLSYLFIIPLIVIFGGNTPLTLEGAATTVGELFTKSGAGAIRSEYITYIGAGALAAGGIISLVKNLPMIIRTFRDSLKGFSFGSNGAERTAQDINIKIVLIAILLLTLLVWLVPAVPVSLVGAAIVVIFGFFFATVSSRMVGLVGSSNNPVSGMAIATLLIATSILKLTGDTGAHGMRAAIAIGSIICIVAAISGDTSQDLKTGYLLGATPKKQQIGEVIGAIAGALAIGGTLYLLDSAYHFGTPGMLEAPPQAAMMKTIVEGIMSGNLPWHLIILGACIAVVVELIGIPVLPFAIGVYLPIQLNACIMVGGLVRLLVDRIKNKKQKDAAVNSGILYCSGMIAGEGLAGIILAVLAIITVGDQTVAEAIDLSERFGMSKEMLTIFGAVLFALAILSLMKFSIWSKEARTAKKEAVSEAVAEQE